jgi:putative tricarboxylic transport membrane protein
VTASNIVSQIRAGKLKGFVLTARKRLPDLPDLPTAAKVGIPGLAVSAWYGLFAPAGAPKPIVDRLSKALQSITQDPKVAAKLARLDTTLFDPSQATPKALGDKLASEIKFWSPLVKKALKEGKK